MSCPASARWSPRVSDSMVASGQGAILSGVRRTGGYLSHTGIVGKHAAAQTQSQRRPTPQPGIDHRGHRPNAHPRPNPLPYVQRDVRAEGRTTKEIMRSLKRYITRQLYRTLAAAHPAPATP